MFRWTRTPSLQNEKKGYASGPPRPSHVLSFFTWLKVHIKTKYNQTTVMFVFRKLFFGKSFSKFFCVCLPLEKLVNGKHFLVNGKHFPVNEKFSLVFRKMFSLLAVFVF